LTATEQDKKRWRNQRDRVLERLERGLTINRLEADRELNVLRLGARIYELRKAGWNVKSRRVQVGPDGARISEYWLGVPQRKENAQ